MAHTHHNGSAPALESRNAAAAAAQPAARPVKVLFFAAKESWPPNTGARLRHYYLARELGRDARLTFISFSDDGAPRRDETGGTRPAARADRSPLEPSTLPPLTEADPACHRLLAIPGGRPYTPAKILRGLVGRMPLPVLNYQTPEMEAELRRLMDEEAFDIVQIESIQLISYVPVILAARRRPKIILDWHNIESEIIERYGQHAPSLARRVYARLTARRLAALEVSALSLFDAHLTVSDRDRDRLLEWVPGANVRTIENGVDVSFYTDVELDRAYRAWPQRAGGREETAATAPRHRVLFVGSMDYHANVDAVTSFAREAWPEIYRKRPDLTFTIVGRSPRPEVQALAQLPGIEVTGTVDDVRPYYCEAVAEVVPLRVGGGSRLKILEAMAAGVPVVSTRLGAEGLAVRDHDNILLTDAVEDLAGALLQMLVNAPLAAHLSREGRALVRNQYDWQAIGVAVRRIHRDLLASDVSPVGRPNDSFGASTPRKEVSTL